MLTSRALVFAAAAVSLICAASARAQYQPAQPPPETQPPPPQSAPPQSVQPYGRTQYQNLYYTDPTVAAPGRWLFGINAEGWGVAAAIMYSVNTSTGSQTKTSYVTGYQAGGDIYVGYDNILVQFQALGGQSSTTFLSGTTSEYKTTFQSEQFDLSVRYSFPGVNWQGFTPFVIVGYDYLHMPVTDTLTMGATWAVTGTSVRNRTYNYNTGYVGFGALYEINELAGFRFDLDLGWGFGSQTQSGATGTANGNGAAALGHATVYYHFLPEWTFQLGIKGAALTMSNGIEPAGGLGGFLSVGYLHRF
jgi:hypothetical protein